MAEIIMAVVAGGSSDGGDVTKMAEREAMGCWQKEKEAGYPGGSHQEMAGRGRQEKKNERGEGRQKNIRPGGMAWHGSQAWQAGHQATRQPPGTHQAHMHEAAARLLRPPTISPVIQKL